jgi:hypothetical protein
MTQDSRPAGGGSASDNDDSGNTTIPPADSPLMSFNFPDKQRSDIIVIGVHKERAPGERPALPGPVLYEVEGNHDSVNMLSFERI